jgi:hypothetical protein
MMPNMRLAEMFYAMWYKEKVSPNLTEEVKKKLMMKLSDLSLEQPIWLIESIPLDDYPELKPFASTQDFSGKQLYVVFSEIFNEVSETKVPTPWPHFPEKKE